MAQADIRVDLVTSRGRGKATIVGGDHSLAAEHTGETRDALRDELGMFDEGHAVGHDAGHQEHIVRQLHVFPNLPLVLVARVGGFYRKRTRVDASIRSTKCLSSRSFTRGATLVL